MNNDDDDEVFKASQNTLSSLAINNEQPTDVQWSQSIDNDIGHKSMSDNVSLKDENKSDETSSIQTVSNRRSEKSNSIQTEFLTGNVSEVINEGFSTQTEIIRQVAKDLLANYSQMLPHPPPKSFKDEIKQIINSEGSKVIKVDPFDIHTPRVSFLKQKPEKPRKNSFTDISSAELLFEEKLWHNQKYFNQLEIIDLEYRVKYDLLKLIPKINHKKQNSFLVRMNYKDQDLLLNKDNTQAPANDGISQKHCVLIHSKIIRLFYNKFYEFLHQTFASLIKVLAHNQIMIESEEDSKDQDNKLIIEKLLSMCQSKGLNFLAVCSNEIKNEIFKNDEGDLKALDDFIFETQMLQIMESFSIRSAYLPPIKQIFKVQGKQISFFVTKYRYNEILRIEYLEQQQNFQCGRTQYSYFYLLQILGILIDIETFKEEDIKEQIVYNNESEIQQVQVQLTKLPYLIPIFFIDDNGSLQIAKLSSQEDKSILEYLIQELKDEIQIEIDFESENLREPLMKQYLKMLNNIQQYEKITQLFIHNHLYQTLIHFWTYYSFGKNTETFLNYLFNSSNSWQRQELAQMINRQVQSMHFSNSQPGKIKDESGEEDEEPSYRFNSLAVQWQWDERENPWMVNGQAPVGKPQWKDFTPSISNILEMAFNENQEIAEFRLEEPYYVELSAFIQRYYRPEQRIEQNEKQTVHKARQIRRKGLRFCLFQLQCLIEIYSKFQNKDTNMVSNELSQMFLKSVQEIFPRFPIETIVGQLQSSDIQYDSLIFYKKPFLDLKLFFNDYFKVEEDFQGKLILDIFALYFNGYDLKKIDDENVVKKLFTFFNCYTDTKFMSQGMQHLREKYNINDRIVKKREEINYSE